jgi:hypothetical protein
MKFDEAIDNIGTITDLRRFASAHVVDYSNLRDEDAIRAAIKKVKPQYLHEETVRKNMECAFYEEEDLTKRVLSKLIICDIILEEAGFALRSDVLEERVIGFEQKVVDKSNEVDIADIAGNKKSKRYADLQLYNFVLAVAWEHRNTKSPDEANLLHRLRKRLNITEYEHRILETRLGKFPKPNNELHNRSEISDVRKFLQSLGILITIRENSKAYFDVIPEEMVAVMRSILGKDMRVEGYRMLLDRKELRKKSFLTILLSKSSIEFLPTDSAKTLTEYVMERLRPSETLSLLTIDDLYAICSDLGLTVSGHKEERIRRIIGYYDQMHIGTVEPDDPRELYFEHFLDLANRNRDLLRAKKIIDKDIEIEHLFEQATSYLFEKMLNHTPLNQPGSNRPDGLVSFKDMYLMWDNKSKEEPGQVCLKDHIKQFDTYIDNSDKHVPIFLVIAPDFTPDSELLAIQYSAEKIGRNIVLITAMELKSIAEKWHDEKNKRRDEPFPLGLFGSSGRFNLKTVKKLI